MSVDTGPAAAPPAVTEEEDEEEKQQTSGVVAEARVTDKRHQPAPQEESGSDFSSMESLADMTVCPVHFGRLDRPKLLPCGHVFCMACLDKWSEQQQHQGGQLQQLVECPMCRRRFHRPESGAAGLPTATAHQAILEYLVTHAAKQQQRKLSHPKQQRQQQQQLADPGDGGGGGDNAPADEQLTRLRRNRSLEMRQDLLTQISVDLVRRADTGAAPEAFNREELAGVRDNLSRVLQRLEAANGRRSGEAVEASESDEESFESEAEEDEAEGVYDAEMESAAAATPAADAFAATQREMHRLSRYRLRELPVVWNLDADENEDPGGGSGGGIAGAGLLRRPVNGPARQQSAPTLVLLGENSRSILVQRGVDRRNRRQRLARVSFDDQLPPGLLDPQPELADFHSARPDNPPLLERRLRVASIQVARGVVYLTGWIGRHSLLAIVSLEEEGAAAGVVLRCHAREEATEAEAALGFAGFHVEPRGPAVVVAAQPGRRRVEFFGEDLQPTGHWLVFDRLTPRHVAWASQSETLWVSCPDERLVLAVNDRTGVFRKLSTGEIFQSPPGHIVAGRTPDGDCRVVLADPEQGRLYWIRKRRKYIFLQRLQVSRQLPGITSLSAMDGGQLLVTSRDRLFQLKPIAGAFSTTRRDGRLKCELL